MLMTKVKFACVAGLVALAAAAGGVGAGRMAQADEPTPAAKPAAPPVKPVPPAAKPRVPNREDVEIAESKKFAGTWSLVSQTTDGKPAALTDRDVSSRITFDGRHRGQVLVRESSVEDGERTDHFEASVYILNPHRKLKELFITGVGVAYIYEFDGDTLRMATFQDTGFDRPHGFAVADQPPGSPGLEVTVWKRVRVAK